MASKKSDEEPEAQDVDPEPVVDPPEATAVDTTDDENSPATETVVVTQTAMVTLPSGASYALSAGEAMDLQTEDAEFIIGQGYGVKADEPSEG